MSITSKDSEGINLVILAFRMVRFIKMVNEHHNIYDTIVLRPPLEAPKGCRHVGSSTEAQGCHRTASAGARGHLIAISGAMSTKASTDLEAILVAISLALCNFKSLRFEIAAIPICNLGIYSERRKGVVLIRGVFQKCHLAVSVVSVIPRIKVVKTVFLSPTENRWF